jgi:hypothetical protein
MVHRRVQKPAGDLGIALDTGADANLSAARASLSSTDPYLDSFSGAGFQPDGQFVIGWSRPNGGRETEAFPSSGGAPIPIMDAICYLRWPPDGKFLYLSVLTGMQSAGAFGRTYVIPLALNKLFPPLPPDGFHSEEEIAKLPGVRVIEAADIFPGPTPETYAYSRQSVQRNLYRVPLP